MQILFVCCQQQELFLELEELPKCLRFWKMILCNNEVQGVGYVNLKHKLLFFRQYCVIT